jgi:hypothetical protein
MRNRIRHPGEGTESGTVFIPHFVHQVQQQIFGSQETGAQRVPVCVEKEAA